MASSRPSAFILEDDDDWGTLSPLPSTMSRLSSTSSLVSSGEWGGKRELWVIDADKSPCLGKVGANNNKFCVKPRLEGLLHCGKGRHSVKFQPTKNVAYIK